MKRVALVGGAGPLGQFLFDYLSLTGYHVELLGRSGTSNRSRLDVLDPIEPASIRHFDVIIYLAWDTHDRRLAIQMQHADAAARWAAASQAVSSKFIFASSTLASKVSLSNYGRAKWTAETMMVSHQASVLRIGLVCDDAYDFFATRLRRSRMIRRLSFIASRVAVHPVSSAAVGDSILRIMSEPADTSFVWVAEPCQVSLTSVIRHPAESRSNRPFRTGRIALRPLRLFSSRISSVDRILGVLGDSRHQNSSEISCTADVQAHPWSECLVSPP